LYLAYNKSIALEAAKRFPKTTLCSTTHSLAYRAVVNEYHLSVGTFNARDITEYLPYEDKALIVGYIKEFCLSSYLDFDTFAKENDLSKDMIKYANKYLELMETGKIPCTHDFYLKFFHLALHNKIITYDKEFDFIMLDEAGDINEVTLEIFLLLPAKFKIATGDKHQNIYSFNHTINAFALLEDKATFFNMTKSFRVSKDIANTIQGFVHRYLDKTMVFEGVDLVDKHIETRAFIARTNSSLVSEMIKLQKSRTPYTLIRKAVEIFKHPLMVMSFKYQGFISDPQYKHLQDDIDTFFEDVLPNNKSAKLLMYLMEKHPYDYTLCQAIKTVIRFGYKDILNAYEYAKKLEGSKASKGLVLATSHSVKGLEFDEVTISNDLSELITSIITEIKLTGEINEYQLTELNLAYVACSRARKYLYNASFLNL
jgi:superfamily I DNA/RNA helicase